MPAVRWGAAMTRALLLNLAAVLAAAVAACGPGRASGPLPHEVYVWQRAWTPAVRDAVAAHGGDFDAVTVLAAEVGWERGPRQVARVDVDWGRLAGARAVGLALRVGPFDRASFPSARPASHGPGEPFRPGNGVVSVGPLRSPRLPTADFVVLRDQLRPPGPDLPLRGTESHAAAGDALAELAAEVDAAARAAGVRPRELQIDFDAPTAGLGDYAEWLARIHARVPDLPLVITALPTWLDAPAFADLAGRVDAFVLQVHSVTRPTGPDAVAPLCDPAASRRWIERAAALGRPFRVALPTYGYRLGFAPDGHLLGLTAEAPARPWPPDTTVRELRADPAAMSALVAALTRDHPANLVGVSWYRLPIPGDALVWSDATFAAVRRGEPVAPALAVTLAWPEPTLAEVRASNAGTADAALPAAIRVSGPTPLASDGQSGYTRADTLAATLLERGPAVTPLAPGATRPIGWLRFASPPSREDVVVTVAP